VKKAIHKIDVPRRTLWGVNPEVKTRGGEKKGGRQSQRGGGTGKGLQDASRKKKGKKPREEKPPDGGVKAIT